MEFVKVSVNNRGQHQAGDPDYHEPAEKGVEGGEQLATGGPHRVNRSHPAQNHRGVEQRVDPGQPLEEMVTAYA